MEIQPDKQNLDQVFSTTVYFIDFYQRDYKWTDEPVKRFLDDVFYQFEETYEAHKALDPNKENVNAKYPWYYLNTYVTNNVSGRVFVVDGQQRLTTLTLVLLKLHSMAKRLHSKTAPWLERKIAGYSGTEHEFWMNHVRHIHVLSGLMSESPLEEIDTSSGITAVNMLENYKTISSYLEPALGEDLHRFESFVHYFLFRLVLINLSVDTHHVPMVFEVINDRGVKLKPYEILKGKLLGQIDKIELENGNYNALWEDQVGKVNAQKDDEIDNFFRYWLKSKFADNRKQGQRFDGDYHREMFKNDMNEMLALDHNPSQVKTYLKGAFRYYTNLYARILAASKSPTAGLERVFCNGLNELDSQFLLILAACGVDDPDETAKIAAVSSGLDRMFTFLQLQGSYDSNEFATRLYDVAVNLRTAKVSDFSSVFDRHLLAEIRERRGNEATEAFSYGLFRQMSIDRLNTRFTRYIFGRVDHFLAAAMKQEPKHPLKDLVTLRGAKNGFHVEHILSHNADNLGVFDNDKERFDQERNRLGGILLLKGKDNISSSNEPFVQKLKSYANTLLWNETLRADAYKSKLDFLEFTNKNALSFRALDSFGPSELEERQRLLFDVIQLAWAAQ